MRRVIDPSALPSSLKSLVKIPRALTSRIRVLPDFIIIGAHRCGTTSLYRYLIEHPQVAPAFRKEVQFFSRNFRKGLNWYREHFPSYPYNYSVRKLLGRELITGEASTDYVWHPRAAERVFNSVPQVKLIAILRNPVNRAYSHYFHEVRKGRENLSFADAIRHEAERLKCKGAGDNNEDKYITYNYLHHSYLKRGLYADQLKAWKDLFPKEQLLILRSEDFYADPSSVLSQTLEFLHLERWEPDSYEKYNYGGYTRLEATKFNYPPYPPMDADVRKTLIDHFKPYNERLYKLLDRDFKWDR